MLRAFAVAALAALIGGSCRRAPPPLAERAATSGTAVAASSPSGSATPARGSFKVAVFPNQETTFSYPSSPAGPLKVVISVPAGQPAARYPVLVALHGRGEAHKGVERGARGWLDDYGLPRAAGRLRAPPLDARDFKGFVEASRLERINRSLSELPYQGVIVVCPYTPDFLAGDRSLDAARPFAAFLVDEILPRVVRELPALEGAGATGIDGVSLGGRAALLVAFERPKAFGVVGALQAALTASEVAALTERARRAREQNPSLQIRLLTSHDDYFVAENKALSQAFRRAGVTHELLLVPGPHDYDFNRGPGVYEMLLLHDRALRGRPPI